MKTLIFNIIVWVMLSLSFAVKGNVLAGIPEAPNDHYVWDTLQDGKTVYIDRSYTFNSIPALYQSAGYLMTSNADKTNTAADFLKFQAYQDVKVYVAHDIRITQKPSWLSTWVDTDEYLVTTDATLQLYTKDFFAGIITLGGNGGGARSSMYTVLVTAKDAVVDVTPPSQPAGLSAIAVSATQIDLAWGASSDDTAVSGYVVFRDGVELGTTIATSYSDHGLQAATAYTYSIIAYDEAGNLSSPSAPLAETTKLLVEAVQAPYSTYEWGTLDVGKLVYIDRDYTYTEVPSAFIGMDYLITANQDKSLTGDSVLHFYTNADVTVYVAHDERIDPKPLWLQQWHDTGELLVTDDATLRMYSREFATGSVALGGNDGGTRSSMYAVLVAPRLSADLPAQTAIPVANADSVFMDQNTTVNISVLANDTGLDNTPVTVTLSSSPAYGSARVESDNTITYTPVIDFSGADSLMYQIKDADGDVAIGTVSIQIDPVVKCNF